MKMKKMLNQNKLQKQPCLEQVLLEEMMMNKRNFLSIKDIVKQVRNQTLKILLTLRLLEKKKLDAIERIRREWLDSLMKKLVLDLMMKKKMTFKNKLIKTTLKKTRKDLTMISMDSLSKLMMKSLAEMMKRPT